MDIYLNSISEKDIDPDKTGITTRRDALRTATALGIGAVTLPALSKSVQAAETPQEWEDTEDYKNYLEFNVTHSSGLQLYKSFLNSSGTEWEHQFVAAGHCVTAKNGEQQADIFSNVIEIDEQNSCLGTKSGVDAQTQGMYPQPDGSSGTDAEDLSLAVLELVADAVGSTAGVAVLTGTQLLNDILNAFTSTSGGMPITWEGAYSNQGGVSEAAHHWEFDIVEDTTCGQYFPSMSILSQLGSSTMEWSITFGQGSVGASTSSLLPMKEKSEWGDPNKMNKREREYFGVQRVSPGQVKNVDLSSNPDQGKFWIQSGNKELMLRRGEIKQIREDGPAWIATNPPVSAEVSHSIVDQSR